MDPSPNNFSSLLAQNEIFDEDNISYIFYLSSLNEKLSLMDFLRGCGVSEDSCTSLADSLILLSQANDAQALSEEESIIDIADNVADSCVNFDWVDAMDKLEQNLSRKDHHFSGVAKAASLLRCGGKVEEAETCLIHSFSTMAKCRPCRHMLTSGCFRSDCKFDHVLDGIPCKYWLTSGCLKASGQAIFSSEFSYNMAMCPFMHDILEAPQQNRFELSVDAAANSAGSVEVEFPALSSGTGRKASAQGMRISYANKIKAGSTNQLTATKTKVSSSASTAVKGKSPVDSVFQFDVRGAAKQPASLRTVLPRDWVVSGKDLSDDYSLHREEARQMALGRNKLLQEATKAYVGGSRGQARSLSQQGQELNDRMKECHKLAAQAIFRKRNTIEGLQSGTVDLHGLHVAEARECLVALLPALVSSLGSVRVITGTGHHTLGGQKGKSRLLPAVIDVCYELGFRTSNVKDDNGHIGGVIVTRGIDALKFLQGQCTNDVEKKLTEHGNSVCAAFLTPKGRIFTFGFLYCLSDSKETRIAAEVPTNLATELHRYLSLFKLRSKVTISLSNGFQTYYIHRADSGVIKNQILICNDPRYPAAGQLVLANKVSNTDLTPEQKGWISRYYIINGFLDEVDVRNRIPLECNMDLLNYISFNKGCYVGQELTARTKYTGLVRKRMVPFLMADDSDRSIAEQHTFTALPQEVEERLLREASSAAPDETALQYVGAKVYDKAFLQSAEKASAAGEVVHVSADGKMGLAMVNLEKLQNGANNWVLVGHSKMEEKLGTSQSNEDAPQMGPQLPLKFISTFRPKWFDNLDQRGVASNKE